MKEVKRIEIVVTNFHYYADGTVVCVCTNCEKNFPLQVRVTPHGYYSQPQCPECRSRY